MTKRRWAIGLGIGVPVFLTATFLWLTRAPSTPSFVENHPHEHMWSYVAGTFHRQAADYACFNVQVPIERLLDEIQHTGGPKNVESTKDYRGYYMRYLDPSSPFLSVQITQARMTWSKSFYYYDNQYPASFSDGWTSVEICYRPNLHSWLSSFWTEEVATRLGKKPELVQRVLTKQGLQRY